MSLYPDQINALSAQINAYKVQRRIYLAQCASIDTEMREGVSFELDLAESQLEIVYDLLDQSREQRNLQTALVALNHKFIQIRGENLKCYQSLLGARDALMKDGREVPLTDDLKTDLIAEFIETMDKVETTFYNQFSFHGGLGEEALNRTKHLLEERIAARTLIYQQMLEQKTAINTKAIDILNSREYTRLKNERKELIASITSFALWQACESGDVHYVYTNIEQLSQIQKYSVVNSPDADGRTLLHSAVRFGKRQILSILLDHEGDVLLKDGLGYQPLHYAAINGDEVIAAALIEHGAPINERGEKGKTPLHCSAFYNHLAMTLFLLGRKADINAQDDRENTSLHEAVGMGNSMIVAALIKQKDLRVDLRNKKNETALFLAVKAGDTTSAALIMSHPSWRINKDKTDPNSLFNLCKIKPRQNQEAMKKLFDPFAKG